MNETIELDLREIGTALLKQIWAIILCAVIAGLGMLVYTANFVTPTYKADVTMYVNNSSGVNSQYMSSSDLAVAQRLVETYTNIISSHTVLSKVAEASNLNITADQIRGMLRASAVGETEMFKVSVIAPDPQLAADLANVIAEVAPGEITKIIPGSTAKVVDYARIPKSRYSPSYTSSTILAFVVGGVLAAAVVVAQLLMDNRIGKKEDLEKICPLPVLGSIPEMDEEPQKPSSRKVRH
ncbi:MAG: hypothetical protein IJB02_04635 [Oscillospiraceae bacterium]|nr:hypothetical protein [Oscillospiraceae bacterium]MBQ7000304.1 hypothetical protein [Oscillospiraceae bacterium]